MNSPTCADCDGSGLDAHDGFPCFACLGSGDCLGVDHAPLATADRDLAAQFAGDTADFVLQQGYVGGLP